jgi:hypothetical protein
LGDIDEDVLVEDVFLESSNSSSVAQYFLSNQERDCVPVSGSFEGQNDVDVVGFSEVPDLSSDVFAGSPL